MRLTCPNCLTEYDVPEAAVAGRPRTLRCAYCGHQWRREAAEAAARPDDASEAAISEARAEPDSATDSAAPEAPLIDAPPLLPRRSQPPTAPSPAPQKPPAAGRPPPLRPVPRPMQHRRRRWPPAVLLLLVVVAVAGLAAHRPIARAWPASAPFFQSLGLK